MIVTPRAPNSDANRIKPRSVQNPAYRLTRLFSISYGYRNKNMSEDMSDFAAKSPRLE
jgi:hypothetical protein